MHFEERQSKLWKEINVECSFPHYIHVLFNTLASEISTSVYNMF